MKTTQNKIFGGYTNIPWKKVGRLKIDKGLSFVFSLKNDQLWKLKVKKGGYEVFHEEDKLIKFYGAFGIENNCN